MSTRQAGVVWSLAAALLSGAVGAQQPYRVADVNTTTTGSAFSHRFNRWLGLTQSEGAVLAGVAYLALDDGVHGTELWRRPLAAEGQSLLHIH